MKRSDKQIYKSFDQTYLRELVEKFDIVEFIGEYLPVSSSGKVHKTLCPFHTEKTPSFVISNINKMYYCFGCKKGGNIITFLTDKEGMSFYEAVIFLSEKAGLDVPTTSSSAEYEKFRATQKTLFRINELTNTHWRDNLKLSPEAQTYLNDRGITQSTADLFSIGFAKDGWTHLTSHLKTHGFTENSMVLAGVSSLSSSNSAIDKFRNRIITPVFNIAGKIVGFSGRTLVNTSKEAKYINSPDTPTYSKGKHLFGLHVTKDHIRSKGFAIVTEGNFDVISLYQNGVTNVVAGLGTSFTSEQAQLLKRFSNRVVLCYDGDKAGAESAKRTIKTLQAEGFIIKVMELPSGQDPDSYIREHGKDEFNTLRGQSVSWFSYMIKELSKEHDLTNPTDKINLLNKIKDVVSFASTQLERREYFYQATQWLKIDPDTANNYWKQIANINTGVIKELELPTYSLKEGKLIELLLVVDDREVYVNKIKKYIQSPQIKKILLVLSSIKGKFNHSIVESILSDEENAILLQLALESEEQMESIKDVNVELDNCVNSILRESLQLQLEELSAEVVESLKNAQDGWEEKAKELMSKQVKIAKEIKALSLV